MRPAAWLYLWKNDPDLIISTAFFGAFLLSLSGIVRNVTVSRKFLRAAQFLASHF
jgi:hypothetical protein